MGLFDKVLSGTPEKLTEQEGMAGVALCAIASDGVVTEEEAGGIATTLARMKLYRGMGARDVNKMFEKCIKVIRASGPEQLLEMSVAAIKPELRPTAFAIAADLLMADGDVAPQEKQFLEKIQKNLGVNDDLALKVVEVIALKNKG